MQALVLSKRDFRESDQMVSFYTLEHGKLELLARGSKKSVSKHAPFLEPYSLADITIAPGKKLDHLTKVQSLQSFAQIRQDLQRSMAAQYLMGLVGRITKPGEPDEQIFGLLHSWLAFVDFHEKYSPLLLDAVILKLFNILGFTPILDRCVLSGAGEGLTGFSPRDGGVLSTDSVRKRYDAGYQILACGDDERGILSQLLAGNWDEIAALSSSKKTLERVHAIVYQFVLAQGEQKLSDWALFDRLATS